MRVKMLFLLLLASVASGLPQDKSPAMMILLRSPFTTSHLPSCGKPCRWN